MSGRARLSARFRRRLVPLLVAPGPGLTLEDKQGVNVALLKSGASISEMNVARGTSRD